MLETSIFKLRSGHYRIMNIHNFTGAGRRTETLKELFCSTPSFTSGIEGYSKCLSALNIFLSITAFLGNTLILVALRKGSVLFSVFVDNDCHKRGQTSCPVVGAEIQTSCNFEAHIFGCSYLLGYGHRHSSVVHCRSPYNSLVWPYRYAFMHNCLNRLVHKDFLRAKSSSHPSTRSCTTTTTTTATTEPYDSTEHSAIQKGSVQCTVGAVNISCLLSPTLYSDSFA